MAQHGDATPWEYLQTFFADGEVFQNANDRPLRKGVSFADFVSYMAELGRDGWELTAVTWTGHAHVYFFKRPLPA